MTASSASWPYSEAQCPRCRYLHPFDPPILDDDGYEVLGFCRHPRIGMELFQLARTKGRRQAPCPCFIAKTRESATIGTVSKPGQ